MPCCSPDNRPKRDRWAQLSRHSPEAPLTRAVAVGGTRGEEGAPELVPQCLCYPPPRENPEGTRARGSSPPWGRRAAREVPAQPPRLASPRWGPRRHSPHFSKPQAAP